MTAQRMGRRRWKMLLQGSCFMCEVTQVLKISLSLYICIYIYYLFSLSLSTVYILYYLRSLSICIYRLFSLSLYIYTIYYLHSFSHSIYWTYFSICLISCWERRMKTSSVIVRLSTSLILHVSAFYILQLFYERICT